MSSSPKIAERVRTPPNLTDETDEKVISSVSSVGADRVSPVSGGRQGPLGRPEDAVYADAPVIPVPDPVLAEVGEVNHPPTGYANVRMNALRHGILSRHAVLAHEDRAEFDRLLAGLVDEHRPSGPTEVHLVEELASIMWRQQRVLQAEGAAINRSLLSAMGNAQRVSRASAPFEHNLAVDAPEMRDIVNMTPDEVLQLQRDAQEDLEATLAAMRHLWKTGLRAYRKALRALTPSSREQWLELVRDGRCTATDTDLRAHIHEHLYPVCSKIDRQARYHLAIKSQILGEGVRPDGLEVLSRYETHLDRKFERVLAMLIKLRELRLGRP